MVYLKFLTCGSVDDGKSTLLGRLLLYTKSVPKDLIEAAEFESKKFGTQANQLDPALLLDGLDTAKRNYVALDSPGHEEYTRNMVTAASNADAAILLVDAFKGTSIQTFRHLSILSLLNVKNVIVAVNKMDKVDWSQSKFNSMREEIYSSAAAKNISNIEFIPI